MNLSWLRSHPKTTITAGIIAAAIGCLSSISDTAPLREKVIGLVSDILSKEGVRIPLINNGTCSIDTKTHSIEVNCRDGNRLSPSIIEIPGENNRSDIIITGVRVLKNGLLDSKSGCLHFKIPGTSKIRPDSGDLNCNRK